MAEEANKKLAQTYVWHEGQGFMVSTINRPSSALLGPQVYAETFVWEYDDEKRERGSLIGQDDDSRDSIYVHQRMVQRLFKTGRCDEPETD